MEKWTVARVEVILVKQKKILWGRLVSLVSLVQKLVLVFVLVYLVIELVQLFYVIHVVVLEPSLLLVIYLWVVQEGRERIWQNLWRGRTLS